jgi:hypothetical protein
VRPAARDGSVRMSGEAGRLRSTSRGPCCSTQSPPRSTEGDGVAGPSKASSDGHGWSFTGRVHGDRQWIQSGRTNRGDVQAPDKQRDRIRGQRPRRGLDAASGYNEQLQPSWEVPTSTSSPWDAEYVAVSRVPRLQDTADKTPRQRSGDDGTILRSRTERLRFLNAIHRELAVTAFLAVLAATSSATPWPGRSLGRSARSPQRCEKWRQRET